MRGPPHEDLFMPAEILLSGFFVSRFLKGPPGPRAHPGHWNTFYSARPGRRGRTRGTHAFHRLIPSQQSGHPVDFHRKQKIIAEIIKIIAPRQPFFLNIGSST